MFCGRKEDRPEETRALKGAREDASGCISAGSPGRCGGPVHLDPALAGNQDQRLVLEGAGDPPILTLPSLSTAMKLSPIVFAAFPTM